MGQLVASVPSGLSVTPPQGTKKKKKDEYAFSLRIEKEQANFEA
jgi:hypothetical protein